jgi:Zn-dependent metalloprotease
MRRVFSCFIALLTIGLSSNLLADEAGVSEDGMAARRAAEAYFKEQGTEGIVFRNLYVDRLGQAHVRYDQTHMGIPVFAGQTIVHVALDEQLVTSITDARRQIGPVNIKPSISARSAKSLVRKAEGIHGQLQAETELMVYVADEVTNLAWYVNLIGLDRKRLPLDWIALVDAHNGELLLSYNNLQTKRDDAPGQGRGDDDDDDDDGDGIAVTGSADTLYFGTVELATEVYEDSSFGMRDPSRGGNYTNDMLDNRPGDGLLFIDDDNFWGDFTNIDRATVGADAHFGTSVTWDYYLETHARKGIYNDGKGVLSRVHFGRDYVNAFWSSACQCITYGDGDGVTASPLVSIDIVAHELTHGVTAATANLIYTGESGGLNESISDIFATAAEFYAAGISDTIPDYWEGEDVWTPDVPDDALRYLDDPTRDGRSIDHYDDYTPNMDVHLSSGLANHVFYLMSEGGPHASTGELVTAIGREKAEQVFYRALSAYMTPDTDFAGAKATTMQAAMDLYDSETAQLVGDAWRVCGVD